MNVIDAHIHFWDPERLHYAWLPDALNRRFLPEDVNVEVDGFVFVQADCRDEEAEAEVAWVETLDAPIVGIVGYAPVHEGEAARTAVERLAPRVVGIRTLLQGKPTSVLEGDELVAGVKLLADYDLTFDACVTQDQLPAVTRLARNAPDATIVLDHVGKPRRLDPWRADLTELARNENVYCKLSGLTTEVAEPRPYIEHALDLFGPERCMFGSDWPVATLTTTYQGWLDLLPDDEAIRGGTASRVYKLTGRERPGSSGR
jgi:L-fuconolactonase